MKYMGSKARIAKHILPIMLAHRWPGQCWVEPFVGGGNIIDKVTGPRIGSDIDAYSIMLLKAVRDEWIPPNVVTESDYYHVKENPHLYSMERVAFVGYCCSYAGKWWGGYARGKTSDGRNRNYADEQSRALVKQAAKLQGVTLERHYYWNCIAPKNSIYYCIPEGVLIYQDGSYKPIEEVKEFETNLGNNNICIKKHIRKTANENIIKLKICGVGKGFDIKLSKDHICFVQENNKILEKKACELKIHDKILIDYEKGYNNIIPDFPLNTGFGLKEIQFDPNIILLSELIGFYTAEGHSQDGLVFSFNILECEYLDRVKFLLNNLFIGANAKIREKRPHATVSQTYVCSKLIENYMKLFITGTATNKKLSNIVMNWEPYIQFHLLKSWLKGDGGVEHLSRNRNKICGTTASKELAYQIYNIALRCKLKPNIKERGNAYDIYFTNNEDINILLEQEKSGVFKCKRKHENNYLISYIREISIEKFSGNMYDLTTTEGNFWLFGNMKVHNCDPPYANTTKYSNVFDTNNFWSWAKSKVEQGHTVFVSEYEAPSEWRCIWEMEVNSSLTSDTGSKKAIERLFTL